MVTIPKNNPRQNSTFCKKGVIVIFTLSTVGGIYHWLALMISLINMDDALISRSRVAQYDASPRHPNRGASHSQKTKPSRANNVLQPKIQIQSILQQLSILATQFENVNSNSKIDPPASFQQKQLLFQNNIQKECLPGRDDAKGEINPTTHKNRECLRHVPLKKHDNKNEEKPKQKPRIGIMAPPGYLSDAMSRWIRTMLEKTQQQQQQQQTLSQQQPHDVTDSNNIVEIEVIPTSHVPVYGYGKSHGFTKLIRLSNLPLPLVVWDAYLWGLENKSSASSASSQSASRFESSSATSSLEAVSSSSNNAPTSATLGLISQEILRWHCRLSHVSAHTAMLTLTFDEILNDPTTTLGEILRFVWRDDWEWEGKNKKGNEGKNNGASSGGEKDDWTDIARGLLAFEYEYDYEDSSSSSSSSFENILQLSLAILEKILAIESNANFLSMMQNSFMKEMKLSKDMTKWPCPSFWEGMNATDNGARNDAGGDDIGKAVVRYLAAQMVPHCKDDDPFVQCTVNRDRCEVKGDARCK